MAHGPRLLLVDDDAGFLDVASAALEREGGFVVETASGVEAALETVDGDVDCVLSDHEMGDGTGLELFARLRERRPSVPFVLYTANDSPDLAERALDAGVTDVVRKRGEPAEFAVLANRLRGIVDRHDDAAGRLLAELADSTDDVLWVFDGGFTDLLFVNGSYESVYGGSVADLHADPTSFLETAHPDDRDRVRAATERLSDGEAVDIEYRVNPPDYDHWVWVEAEPIVADGEVVRVAGFSREVTERKENERELEAQNRRLERLASIVSHDLQSPLSVVEGSIDLARETGDDAHLDRAERAAERIGALAEDILTLARRGETVGELVPVTLSAVAERAWDETDTPGARLVVESDGAVEADPQRLRQLFANLFDNAAAHGGDDVLVRLGTVHDGFYVADDGVGVPDDVGTDVFDPTYTTTADGTGLGLDIVRSIAEAHGWTVDLEESVDGGARFAVTAPVRPATESTPE
ncbi:MAG: response regulator [Haloferacaceae archaeon]